MVQNLPSYLKILLEFPPENKVTESDSSMSAYGSENKDYLADLLLKLYIQNVGDSTGIHLLSSGVF